MGPCLTKSVSPIRLKQSGAPSVGIRYIWNSKTSEGSLPNIFLGYLSPPLDIDCSRERERESGERETTGYEPFELSVRHSAIERSGTQ